MATFVDNMPSVFVTVDFDTDKESVKNKNENTKNN